MNSGSPNCYGCKSRTFRPGWLNLDELSSFGKKGCPYCKLFSTGAVRLIPDIVERFGEDAVFRFNSGTEVVLYADPNGSLGYKPGRENVQLTYEYYTDGNAPTTQHARDTSSEWSLEQAKSWIQQCAADHKLCGKGNVNAVLPDRVLDLGEGNADEATEPSEVKLFEPLGLEGQYIALSHCWGGQQPLTTTLATIKDRKAGIPFADLPTTFQHAIEVTRKLGVRYLWIDSLCIIQDSSEDWQVQASRMASIYRNSWLTVSATRSSSPASGCYTTDYAIEVRDEGDGGDKEGEEGEGEGTGSDDSDDDEEDPMDILFPAATQLRKDLRLAIGLEIAHPDFGPFSRKAKANKSFPLLSRAWAYQERLLSPRVLHFGPQELFWECLQDVTCECGKAKWTGAQHMGGYMHQHGREGVFSGGELPPKIAHYAALLVGGGSSKKKKKALGEVERRQKLMGRWEDMVAEYSRHYLSFSKDRLPALSGVAAEMVDTLEMRYCAGLWEETLPLGLLWERDDVTEMAQAREEAQAPTWSWTAMDSPARFLLSLCGPYRGKWDEPIVQAEVKEVVCIPYGKDERGQLEVGESYITLSAKLVSAVLCFEPDQNSNRARYEAWKPVSVAQAKGIKGPPAGSLRRGSFMIKVGKGEPVPFINDIAICDEEGTWKWDDKGGIFCAKIAKSSESWYWLILRKLSSDEDSTYERVGVVGHPYAEWRGGSQETIKIV